MPPSRWSLTSGRLQVPRHLLRPPSTIPRPLQVALKQAYYGTLHHLSYAFKSHSWWQTHDIPRRHSKTATSQGTPLSASDTCKMMHHLPHRKPTRWLQGRSYQRALKVFPTLPSAAQHFNKPPYPQSWYPNMPLR